MRGRYAVEDEEAGAEIRPDETAGRRKTRAVSGTFTHGPPNPGPSEFRNVYVAKSRVIDLNIRFFSFFAH